jgi:hypothetical protein
VNKPLTPPSDTDAQLNIEMLRVKAVVLDMKSELTTCPFEVARLSARAKLARLRAEQIAGQTVAHGVRSLSAALAEEVEVPLHIGGHPVPASVDAIERDHIVIKLDVTKEGVVMDATVNGRPNATYATLKAERVPNEIAKLATELLGEIGAIAEPMPAIRQYRPFIL